MIDPYTNFYTKVIIEGKGNGTVTVLNALQEMRNGLWTSAQGKLERTKEETSMYSGDTTGQPTDTYKDNMACYWCGSKEHKKFSCPKFKGGETRTVGYNGIGKWKGRKKGGGGGNKPKKEKSTVPICGICEKKGHKDVKFYEKAEMADKRPNN